jgi:hypothetical protein
MSYTLQNALDQYLFWPATMSKQWRKHQLTRTRHVPGTSWTAQPYVSRVSYFSGMKKYGSLSYTPRDCAGTTAQDVNGRVYLDTYALESRALNRARGRFVDALHGAQTASIGSALGEMQTSLSMIAGRASALYNTAKCVKSLDIKGAIRSLSAGKEILPPGWRGRVKTAADLWLELRFGWNPLLGDIYDATQAISAPVYPVTERVVSRGSASYYQSRVKTYDSGGSVHNELWLSGLFGSHCEIRGKPRLINPNLELADRLGLINPVATAWELFPFSFLVDHVVGIGDFLSSYSDAIAWEFHDLSVSYKRTCLDGKFSDYRNVGGSAAQQYGADYSQAVAVHTRRETGMAGLPAYLLNFTNPLERLGVARGASYIALLVQTLKSMT